jgi:hypothetical protein
MRLQMALLAVLTWPGVALAADVAVYSGDPSGVPARIEEATGKPASELQIVSLAELVKGRPPVLTAGKITACTSTATDMAAVTSWLQKAEMLAGEMEFGAAHDATAAAMDAVQCLDAPIDRPQVARLAFLEGVMQHFGGDMDASRHAFQLAWTLDPALAWDPQFPPSAMANFTAAKDDVTKATKVVIAVVPHAGLPIVVDGAPVQTADGKIEVGMGPHIFQIGKATLMIDAAAPASLVVPSALPEDATKWASDPARGADLARLLDTIDATNNVYVVTNDAVWLNQGSSTSWKQLGADTTKKEPPLGLYLIGSGGAVFVGGAAITAVGLSQGNGAVADASAPGVRYEDWEAAQTRYQSAKTLTTVGKVVALTGLVTAGSGVSLLQGQARIAPLFLADGGGLALSIGEVR